MPRSCGDSRSISGDGDDDADSLGLIVAVRSEQLEHKMTRRELESNFCIIRGSRMDRDYLLANWLIE